jgi:hypothetical protein
MTKLPCLLALALTPWQCCHNADVIAVKASSLSLPSADPVGRFANGGMVVGVAMTTMTMTTVGTALPPPMDFGATAVDDGREDLATVTAKHQQWGQWTANKDCHRNW